MEPQSLPQKKLVHHFTLFLIVGVCLGVYALPLLPPHYIGTAYITIHLILTVLVLIVWHQNISSIKLILFTGIVIRLILIGTPLITSNDVTRYLWDGAVSLAGFDPYTTAPNMIHIADLKAIWPTPEEHAKYASLYPPGTMVFFAISALGGPVIGVWIWKSIIALASIASLFVMRALLKTKNLERHFALFALSPLLLLEGGVGAHLDILITLSVVGAFWFIEKNRFFTAGMIIGWGITIKFLPILLLGPLLFLYPLKKYFTLWAGTIIIIGLSYSMALAFGWQAIGVLPEFFEKWRGGSPFYAALEGGVPAHIMKFIIGALLLTLFSYSLFLALKKRPYEAITISLSAPLLLSPVIFPWYLCALVPLLALTQSRMLLLWMITLPLTYEVLNLWISKQIWEAQIWPLWIIAFAILCGLVLDHLKYIKRTNSKPIG